MTKNFIFSKNSIFKLILNFFSVTFFFDFWKMLYQYLILNAPETFFWYVQGAEVEFLRPNSTSAPCIHQKTTQNRKKQDILKNQINFFLNSFINLTNSTSLSFNYIIHQRGHFWLFPVTSGRIFLHQKIVSSLQYNILGAQSRSIYHIFTITHMKIPV